MRQICEEKLTDKDGFRLYPIGSGSSDPTGLVISYRNVYVNPNSPVVDLIRVQSGETMILYHKASANHAELDEILRQMRSCTGNINICNTLYSVKTTTRFGLRTKWTRLIRFDGLIIGMGERMYANWYMAVNNDENLKARLTNV